LYCYHFPFLHVLSEEHIFIDLENDIPGAFGSTWLSDVLTSKSPQTIGSLTGEYRRDEAKLTNCDGGQPLHMDNFVEWSGLVQVFSQY